jgi:hypothetical protein
MSEIYTSSLPVLSQEMIAKWKAEGNPLSERVFLSDSPDVFKNFHGEADRLCIWHRRQTPEIQQFVSNATEMLGKAATDAVDMDIASYGEMKLVENELMGKTTDSIVTAASIASFYQKKNLQHAHAYAEDIVTSLHKILLHMGPEAWIALRKPGRNYSPHCFDGFENRHQDNNNVLLRHDSDPGTPYFMDEPMPIFRTTAGDISLHGSNVMHADATAEPVKAGCQRPRMMYLFAISDF